MNRLQLFALHNEPKLLDAVAPRPFIDKILLDRLLIGDFQRNELCESRIFLSPQVESLHAEYVGFASARWNQKYPHAYNPGMTLTRLEALDALELHPRRVWVAHRVDARWYRECENCHPGMSRYTRRMIDFARLGDCDGPSFWANNFICHKSVFARFLREWRRIFEWAYRKFEVSRFEFAGGAGTGHEAKQDYKPRVKAAYFYETITVLYFASRGDLEIAQIP